MRTGGGATSLLFNNFFVNSVFPTPLLPETSIKKGFLYGVFETFPLKTLCQGIQCHTYSYPYNSIYHIKKSLPNVNNSKT